MTTKNIFRYLLAGVLLMGGTVHIEAQTVKWNAGTSHYYDVDNNDKYNWGGNGGPTSFKLNNATSKSGFSITNTSSYSAFDDITLTSATVSSQRYRACVQELTLTVTVPAKSQYIYYCELNAVATINSSNINTGNVGCELLQLTSSTAINGTTFNTQYDWKNNAYYKHPSTGTGTTSLAKAWCKAFQGCTGNVPNNNYVFSNVYNNTSSQAKTYTYYFAVLSYLRVDNWISSNVSTSLELKNSKFEPLNKITLNGNGGTFNGSTPKILGTGDTKVYKGSTNYNNIASEITTLTKEGSRFTGFFTAATGGNKVYDGHGAFVVGNYWDADGKWKENQDADLYAHWGDFTTVTTFNPEGGSFVNFSTSTITLTMKKSQSDYWSYGSAVTKNGYTFDGWYDAAEGGNQVYTAGGTAVEGSYWTLSNGNYIWNSDEETLNLYAHWTENTESATVVYNTVSVRSDNGSFLRDDINTNTYTDANATWCHDQVPMLLRAFQPVSNNSTELKPVNIFTTTTNNKVNVRVYQTTDRYFALELPRGYRIVNYDIQLTGPNGEADMYRYLNDLSGTSQEVTRTAIDNNGTRIQNYQLSESLSGNTNVIYFKIHQRNRNGEFSNYEISKFDITYAVDNEFTETLPNSDGKSLISTGIYDFGTFNDTYGVVSYSDANVTDQQLVKIYKDTDTADKIDSKTGRGSYVSYFDGYYAVSHSGNYIVEAPKGFRIVKANITYKMAPTGDITNRIKADEENTYCPISPYVMNGSNEAGAYIFDNKSCTYGTYPNYTPYSSTVTETKWCCDFVSGKTYLIFDATVPCKMKDYTLIDALDTYHKVLTQYGPYPWRHWLGWDIYGGNFASFAEAQSVADQKSNTLYWTRIGEFTDDNPGSINKQGNTYSATGGTAATSSKTYDVDEETVGAYRFYRVEVTNVADPAKGDEVDKNKKQQMAEMKINFAGSGHDFYITLPDGTRVYLNSENSEYTAAYTTPDGSETLNNDALLLNFGDLPDNTSFALFKVDLTLLPLDPHIQSVDVVATAGSAKNAVRSTASDFELNEANIIIPTGTTATTYKVSFSNAANANGISDGNSNYYLVGSNLYNNNVSGSNLKTPLPSAARMEDAKCTSTTVAGTVVAPLTNIKDITAGGKLEDKTHADIISAASLSNNISIGSTTNGTYYLYTMDLPLYNYSSTPHVAYRIYKVTVNVHTSEVTPIVNVEPIYDDTSVKTDNNEGFVSDFAGNKYIGVSVGYKAVSTKAGKISDGNGHYLSNRIKQQGQLYSVSESEATEWYIDQTSNQGNTYYQIYYHDATEGKNYYLCRQYKKTYSWDVDGLGDYVSLTDDRESVYTHWLASSIGQVYQIKYDGGSLSNGGNMTLHYNNNVWNAESAGVEDHYVIMFNGRNLVSNSINMSSADIIQAVNNKLTASNYDKDGVLYVDMKDLGNITENGDNWTTFQQSLADNALIFFPSGAINNLDKNVVMKNAVGDGLTAASDFVLTDKQPFYTPYDFKTGNYWARYKREMTVTGHIEESVQHSTLMLPFDVNIYNGRTTSVSFAEISDDDPNCGITYYTLGAIGERKSDKSWAVALNKLTDDVASANTPYHVVIEGPSQTYQIKERNAQVKATPTQSSVNGNVTWSMNSDWSSHSTYYGERLKSSTDMTTGTQMYYFSKGKYWNSSAYHDIYPTIDMWPFRAAFYTNKIASSAKSLGFVFDGEDIDFDAAGIDEVTISGNTVEGVYTVSGIKLNGEPKQHGIYIVNGKKVLY